MLEKLKKIYSYTLKVDYIIFAVLIALALFFMGKSLVTIIILTYIYAAFYYVIAKVIKNQGFRISQIFMLFVPVLIILLVLVSFIPQEVTGA